MDFMWRSSLEGKTRIALVGGIVVLLIALTTPVFGKDKIGELNCTTDGAIAKFNATLGQWECANDETGGGGGPQWVLKDARDNQVGDVLFIDSMSVTVVGYFKEILLTIRFTRTDWTNSGWYPMPLGIPRLTEMAFPPWNYSQPDCDDPAWLIVEYSYEVYSETDDYAYFPQDNDHLVIDIVGPNSPIEKRDFKYYKDGEDCIDQVYGMEEYVTENNYTVVATDILADYPAPYTVEKQ